ncbi:MAG: linear amide C-N hydrolase [Desulfobacula sp.]|nr:linear amide C-N hydrolase [Desulfobacula sp.]
MNKLGIIFLLSILVVFFEAPTSHSCTVFSITKGATIFYGENYDYHVKEGLVVVNKRGVKKSPQVFGLGDQKAASWISKHGSVTFNTLGREYFHGGMNTKGLLVTGLILRGSQYPAVDSRDAVSHAQYKQYLLDNCATVEEVMAVQSRIRIYARNQNYPIHFFIADATGQCVVIEYLNGERVVHKGANLIANVLSNSEYAYAINYLKEHKGFGGKKDILQSRTNSLDRFVRASSMVQSYPSKPSAEPVDYGFKILSSVAQGNRTVWRIIYDVNNMRIYFRTLLNTKLQYIDMKSFDFSCDTPSLVLDLTNTLTGDVTPYFKKYTQKVNQEFIMRMADTYRLPEKILNALTTHVYGLSCSQE